MRSLRRLTVALSRSRLGLYILGRRSVFESCLELKPAFDILFQRPDTLHLVADEMFNECSRGVDDDVPGSEIVGVEHLGGYVADMVRAKVEMIRAGKERLVVEEDVGRVEEEVDDGTGLVDEGDVGFEEPLPEEMEV